MACERVVALVDMDCFYAQVEQRLNPSYAGKPCAVVQYNTWKGGGIIAVSYEARKFGVTRNMRGDEAKEKCPDIILARVPELRGKADLTRYRDAGAEVFSVLQEFGDVCERASVDEAYLDLTQQVQKELENTSLEELVDKTLVSTHIIGYTDEAVTDGHRCRGQWLAALSDERNKCLAMGAVIIQHARDAVKEKTGFTCSAGIAHNKVLAKIAGGTHKPNQQTLLPQRSVAKFFETVPIRKVRFFGGKFGQSVINTLEVEYMSELMKYSEEELQRCFGEKSGTWLYDVCRGRENEVVRSRHLTKSCGCGKNFPGKSRLVSKDKVRYWILQLASELSDRLKIEEEKNQRTARLASVGVTTEASTSGTRSFPLRSFDPESICENAMQVMKTFNSGAGDKWEPAITCLSLSASKFEEISKAPASSSIASFFTKNEDTKTRNEDEARDTNELVPEEISQARTNACPATVPGDLEATEFSYERDEIDQTIMNELPHDIRNEIEKFLGVSKAQKQTKRTSKGIQKYAISRHTDTGNATKSREIVHGNTKTSENEEFQRCSKCGQKIEESKMDEHNDFHFALELQKQGGKMFDALHTREPPKKRQKGSISQFFPPKTS